MGFKEVIYQMNHPDLSAFADRGKAIYESLSDEYKGYTKEVANFYFKTTPEELLGYLDHLFILGEPSIDDFEIKSNTQLAEVLVGRMGLIARNIHDLNPTMIVNNIQPIIIFNDMPGQEQFAMLKSSSYSSLTPYSVIFNTINGNLDNDKIKTDLIELITNFYKPGFPYKDKNHKTLINFTFLDSMLEDENPIDKYLNAYIDVFSKDGLINQVDKLFTDELIKSVRSQLINFLDKEYPLSEQSFINELLGARTNWEDLITSFDFSNKKHFNLYAKLVKTLMNHRKNNYQEDYDFGELQNYFSLNTEKAINYDLIRMLNYLKYSEQRKQGLIGKVEIIGVNYSSARPLLGFLGCGLESLSYEVISNYGNSVITIPANFIGAGGFGKTQNFQINQYWLKDETSWFNKGDLSTTISFLQKKVFKEEFYENWMGLSTLNDLEIKVNENGLETFNLENRNLDLTKISLIAGSTPIPIKDNKQTFMINPEVMKERAEQWKNYVNEALNKIKSFDDLSEAFGIKSDARKILNKDLLIDLLSITEDQANKIMSVL